MPKSNSGFVYLWYDRKHKRFYIGSHWGSPDDGYICSSRWMRKSYRRRPEDFKRRILSIVSTNRTDLLIEEQRWLDMIKPEELKIRYYNLMARSGAFWHTENDEKYLSIKEKISMGVKKKWNDPNYREKNIRNSTKARKEYWQSERGIKEKEKRSKFMLEHPERHPPVQPKKSKIKKPDQRIKHGHCNKNKETRTHYWWRYIKHTYDVCDEWNRFEKFLEDMGECPKDDMIILRKNQNKNYSLENCYWGHRQESYNNRKNIKWIEYKGNLMPLSECARLEGFDRKDYCRLKSLISKGRTADEAIRYIKMEF